MLTLASPCSDADSILSGLLDQAMRQRASDIHLDPRPGGAQVRYRVDGLLHPLAVTLGDRDLELVLGRLKVLADLNIADRRRPQAGSFVWPPPSPGRRVGGPSSSGPTVELRVSFLPTLDGESAAIRFLTGASPALPLGDLGLTSAQQAELRALVARPSGLLLAVGPTGCGKTTTLYALADELAAGPRRVVSVEDPVERRIPGAIQLAVSRAEGLDFASGLRGVLRHDPDVIVVGEVRDAETASICLAASLSGHLVLASLHAEGPLSALERLVHLQVDRSQLVTVLAGVLTQRLVRLACPRKHREMDLSCPDCAGSGFHGRTGLFGLTRPDPALRRRLLSRDADLASGGESLAPLVDQARELMARGLTSHGEAVRVLPDLELPGTDVAS